MVKNTTGWVVAILLITGTLFGAIAIGSTGSCHGIKLCGNCGGGAAGVGGGVCSATTVERLVSKLSGC